MSVLMKIVLQDKKKYRGTKVEYPYREVDERFKVRLQYHREGGICCIKYFANKDDFGKAKKKIEELCITFGIIYGFTHLGKILYLHHLPVNKYSLKFLMKIDKFLNLPRVQLE